ncbi:MAG: response regulator transcription factor [Balneolaceae bacterium]
MANINILLVDDHEIVRDGLKSLIKTQPGLEVVGEAAEGEQALGLCENLEIDLVIMDISMPGMDGIEGTTRIKELYPEIKILALTVSNQDLHVRKMIQAGASGYILKSTTREELKEAIHTIMEGQHYFSSDATRSVMMELVQNKGKPKRREKIEITKREKEVLKLIVREYTNQKIAEKLFISVRTVDAHRRNLLQKTGAKNTAGLVRYALEEGLPDL